MTGMTISEMADELNLPRDTVMRRILRGGYKPLTKDAVYSIDVFEAIKDVPGKGRPKKTPEAPSKPKNGC
jgi:orotate phosphoribosyltransferase-like protein